MGTKIKLLKKIIKRRFEKNFPKKHEEELAPETSVILPKNKKGREEKKEHEKPVLKKMTGSKYFSRKNFYRKR